MAKKKYKAILSDLGNVLVNFDHRIAVKKILAFTHKTEQDIYKLFFDSGITKDYEEGKISSLDFFKRVKGSIGLDLDYDAFLPVWNDIFFETPLNKKYQDFLRSLKNRYKLVMISNINEAHYEFLRAKTPIFKEFNSLVLSYEIGFRKPAAEIYNAALSSIDAKKPDALYIDDRADLIEAASRLGIEGVAFDGEKALEEISGKL